jgi:hypothetical protein
MFLQGLYVFPRPVFSSGKGPYPLAVQVSRIRLSKEQYVVLPPFSALWSVNSKDMSTFSEYSRK